MAKNDPVWLFGRSVLVSDDEETPDPDWSYGRSILRYTPTPAPGAYVEEISATSQITLEISAASQITKELSATSQITKEFSEESPL